MSDVKFDLKPISKKPSRKHRKGSKYDPILDSFLNGDHELVEVGIEDKDPRYLRSMLNKRIEARNLWNEVRAFVDDDRLFLERGKTGVDKNLYRLRDKIEIANIREIIKK